VAPPEPDLAGHAHRYASALFVHGGQLLPAEPVGSHVENGVLRLDDFGALFGNPALTASCRT